MDRQGSIRPATYETLFGLMASTGLRVSEALHLRDADVDLKRGMLTIRQTKFAKSRQLPIHPTHGRRIGALPQGNAHGMLPRRPTCRS